MLSLSGHDGGRRPGARVLKGWVYGCRGQWPLLLAMVERIEVEMIPRQLGIKRVGRTWPKIEDAAAMGVIYVVKGDPRSLVYESLSRFAVLGGESCDACRQTASSFWGTYRFVNSMRVFGKNPQKKQGALLQGCLHKEWVGLAARTLRYVEYGAFMNY